MKYFLRVVKILQDNLSRAISRRKIRAHDRVLPRTDIRNQGMRLVLTGCLVAALAPNPVAARESTICSLAVSTLDHAVQIRGAIGTYSIYSIPTGINIEALSIFGELLAQTTDFDDWPPDEFAVLLALAESYKKGDADISAKNMDRYLPEVIEIIPKRCPESTSPNLGIPE